MEIGAFEAKNKLSALLDRVERGEEIVITRHGRRIARLVPAHDGLSEAKSTLLEMRARAVRAGLGPFDWEKLKADRDHSRP